MGADRELAIDSRRITILSSGRVQKGPVVYWMNRDQRVEDNWALLYAQQMAMARQAPLIVAFVLSPDTAESPERKFEFMLQGLRQCHTEFEKLQIPFVLLTGQPEKELAGLIRKVSATLLVTDFSPLHLPRINRVRQAVRICFHEVDTHNIVPCRTVSSKQEFAAYTIRPKIHRLLDEFLCEIPRMIRHPFKLAAEISSTDWDKLISRFKVDKSAPPVDWLKAGSKAARQTLTSFIAARLNGYAEMRNDIARNYQSDLSPYLHFGQLSAQRIALEVIACQGEKASADSFLEELIVRRELSDNFCLYNDAFDRFEGFPQWARITLDAHRFDPRSYVYTQQQFESAATHDPLWNAAQLEMVKRGKMHGYMRMYWAKKILQWSRSPEEAIEIAISLNDRYNLDGADPNGYTGIAWSIGGVHDRAWGEREIFGKVRYMSYEGCKRKFDVQKYIDTHPHAEKEMIR